MSGKQKRFAIISPDPTGILDHAGALVEEIGRIGHDVTCLAPPIDTLTSQWLKICNASHAKVPLRQTAVDVWTGRSVLRDVVRKIKGAKSDVILGIGIAGTAYAAYTRRRTSCSRVIALIDDLGPEFHDQDSQNNLVSQKFTRQIFKSSLKRCSAVIFHNPDDPDLLESKGLLPLQLPVHVVRGAGVDLSRNHQRSLPSIMDGLTFVMPTALLAHKGIREYVEAATQLKQRFPNTNWLVVGTQSQHLDAVPASELESSAVTYLPAGTDIIDTISKSHIIVLPSHYDGVPDNALLALAAGRPLLTTGVGGLRDLVDEVVNGLVVRPRDAASLADGMEFFLKRPDLIPPMAMASRNKAERLFDVRMINRSVLTLLFAEH